MINLQNLLLIIKKYIKINKKFIIKYIILLIPGFILFFFYSFFNFDLDKLFF